VPVFQYFLVVGSVLTSLIFYADRLMVPAPLPFSVSQINGLPAPYRAPVVVAEAPRPVIIATTAEHTAEIKKLSKAVPKHRSAQVVPQPGPQGRYAAYTPTPHEHGSIW
jgi:hypothetical protein